MTHSVLFHCYYLVPKVMWFYTTNSTNCMLSGNRHVIYVNLGCATSDDADSHLAVKVSLSSAVAL